jgi:hypothetical protein
MNNQDKVAQLQRIISTAQNNLALLMKKGERFKPEINETLMCSCDHIVDVNKKVTRFEVIDHTWAGTGTGRVFAHYGCIVELSYQDDGKTLKVFLKDKEL